ncbi:hypothetical protein ABIB48_000868 [Arthrobacter sp. UYCu511]
MRIPSAVLALVAGLAGGWPGSALARPAATAAALVGGFDATAVARAVLRGERRWLPKSSGWPTPCTCRLRCQAVPLPWPDCEQATSWRYWIIAPPPAPRHSAPCPDTEPLCSPRFVTACQD